MMKKFAILVCLFLGLAAVLATEDDAEFAKNLEKIFGSDDIDFDTLSPAESETALLSIMDTLTHSQGAKYAQLKKIEQLLGTFTTRVRAEDKKDKEETDAKVAALRKQIALYELEIQKLLEALRQAELDAAGASDLRKQTLLLINTIKGLLGQLVAQTAAPVAPSLLTPAPGDFTATTEASRRLLSTAELTKADLEKMDANEILQDVFVEMNSREGRGKVDANKIETILDALMRRLDEEAGDAAAALDALRLKTKLAVDQLKAKIAALKQQIADLLAAFEKRHQIRMTEIQLCGTITTLLEQNAKN